MLSSSTSVFLFRILLKEHLLKSQTFKALLLKIFHYGSVCSKLCLPFIAAIFDHIQRRAVATILGPSTPPFHAFDIRILA